MKIQGRLFIVSGGSSGLGLAAVHELLNNDAYVAILDIAQPKQNLPNTRFIEADVSSLSSIENAVEAVKTWSKETNAPIRGVINCAGIVKIVKMVDRDGNVHDAESWEKTVAINQSGTFHLTRLVVEEMRNIPCEEGEDGERGIVIMVASEAAYEVQLGQVAYAASKGAIVSMTRPMAMDLGRYGIRVVTISPGFFETPLTDMETRSRKEKIVEHGITFPKRFGYPTEFAMTVKYILDCSYLHGEVIRVNAAMNVPVNLSKL